MKKIKLTHYCLLIGFFLGLAASSSHAAQPADWQFSVPTQDGKGRAFLWIPPQCKYVRGIVLSGQVILEKVVMEDPIIREAAAKENLALVLDMKSTIGIGTDLTEKGEGRAKLQYLLDQLAAVSGYSEIAQAPLLTIGHSGGAIFAWHLGYAMPDRCFGVIGLKAAPIGAPNGIKRQQGDGGVMLNNIPTLAISGQYEAWGNPVRTPEYHWRWVRGVLLEFRAIGYNSLVSELVEPGTGHFSWYEELARYVALFIQKAAHYRIPAQPPAPGQAPVLRDIPQEEGWLTDVNFFGSPRHATAAFKNYDGDPSMAFWHMDEELARANDNFGAQHKGKKLQVLTFLDGETPLKPAWMQDLPFRPQADGISFQVATRFLDETPADFAKPVSRPLTHADGPVQYRLIGGWCGGGEQTGPDTFRIKMDRFQWVKPGGSVMLIASHPGDATHALYEQPVQVKYPDKNKEGAPQQITFEPIKPPLPIIGGKTIKLKAVSDSKLPVDFCVVEGPAVIEEGGILRLTSIPPRSKRPVKVTVLASQWGRSVEPKIQTAESVLQTFYLP